MQDIEEIITKKLLEELDEEEPQEGLEKPYTAS